MKILIEKAVNLVRCKGKISNETVCLLYNRNAKPDSYIDVSLNMEDYYKIKDHGKDWKKFKDDGRAEGEKTGAEDKA